MVVRFQRFPLASSTPIRALDFEREIDGLFGNFFNTGLKQREPVYPPIDVAEYENESVVVTELPGVKKEDLKVSIQKGTITISGQRKSLTLPTEAKWFRNESNSGEFLRTIRLPHDVNVDQISAELSNGILRIVLPKADAARLKDIEVK